VSREREGKATYRSRSRDNVCAERRRCGLRTSSSHKGGVVAIIAIHLDRTAEFNYDQLLWGEHQLRSVANMTRSDAHDFLEWRAIGLLPKVRSLPLGNANEALVLVKSDSLDCAAAIIP
jgi:propanol-preferring alcohol dehydrogenase